MATKLIATGIGTKLKFINYFDEDAHELYWGYKTPFFTHPQATIHTKLDGSFIITQAKPKAILNPKSNDLYEAYANEELIFEWQDFDAKKAILEFLGIGGDYFSLSGCTSLKLRAVLLYQIESYFWDLACANWSDVLYQSYVIKPLEILEIKSEFIHHYAEEYLGSIFELLDLQIIKMPRLFEICQNNAPSLIYNKDQEKINHSSLFSFESNLKPL